MAVLNIAAWCNKKVSYSKLPRKFSCHATSPGDYVIILNYYNFLKIVVLGYMYYVYDVYNK